MNSRQGGNRNDDRDKKKKETIFELSKLMDREVRVKLQGGREVTGIVKGYDTLQNIVLDETVEYLRDFDDDARIGEQTRKLGLSVCRGNTIICLFPTDGFGEIDNPFLQAE